MLKSHDASQEIEALEQCQGHDGIVKLIDHLTDDKYTYLVFELLNGGELFSRIRDSNSLPESEAKGYFRQLVEAVQYIHRQNFVHRDLKPENIMFVDQDDEADLKIVDFGYARRENSEETQKCFTLDYAAPESLRKGTTSKSRDSWSLGVILYTMLVGHTPFMPEHINKHHDEEKYRLRLKENINRAAKNTNCAQWHAISDEAKDLIDGLLKLKESKRLSLQAVLDHPWLAQHENGAQVYDFVEESYLIDRELKKPICVDEDSSEDEHLPNDKGTRSKDWSNDSSGISSVGLLMSGNEGSSLSNDDLVKPELPTKEFVQRDEETEPSEYENIPSEYIEESEDDDESVQFESIPVSESPMNSEKPVELSLEDEDFHGFTDNNYIDIGNWTQLYDEQRAEAKRAAETETELSVPVEGISKPKKGRKRRNKEMASVEPRETHLRGVKVELAERTLISAVIKKDPEAVDYHTAVVLEPKKKKAKFEPLPSRYPLRERKMAIEVKNEPVLRSIVEFIQLPAILNPVAVRKGRGRPKKIILETIPEQQESIEERQPVEQSEPLEQSEPMEQTVPEQPRRRRGRPRKNTKMYSKVVTKKQPRRNNPQAIEPDCQVRKEVFLAFQYSHPEPLCNLPFKKYREWKLAILRSVINQSLTAQTDQIQ